MASKKSRSNGRHDAVFICKSTEDQSEKGQTGNVRTMLDGIGITVPDEFWFVGTVGRRKVRSNAEFSRLMKLVESDQIGTVYIESQDRWGTADRPELFNLLGTLRDHQTRLYDLRDKKDLTERDLATEMLAFINSVKSEQELKDISYRSLRTRVNNFKETGSWPTGPQPFGYAKACRAADGTLLWVWQPVSRTRGQMYYPDDNDEGKLKPSGPPDAKITRKQKEQRIVLVPSNTASFIKAVQIVFDLFTRVGLSRRQISARLNAEGYRFYAGPFTHSLVTQILTNPAYVGDIHFGKTQTGELHTFDEAGKVVSLAADHKKSAGTRVRDVARQIVKQDTHEPLIDRKTWNLAQKKMAAERRRTSYAPRNPAYYLKQILVCGHCGKGMAGRTETQPRSKKKTVVYICSTYVAGRCGGHEVECGAHRITHDDAERLLLEKIKELDLHYDELASASARSNLDVTLKNLGHKDDEAQLQWDNWVREGTNALVEYSKTSFQLGAAEIKRVETAAKSIYQFGKLVGQRRTALPLSLTELKNAICEAERGAVATAKTRITDLDEEHRSLTLAWAKASERQQNVLKEELDRIESELQEWEPRGIPISEHLRQIHVAEDERQAERRKLLDEWPTLESREKGEALRRLFNTVALYWDREFVPARSTPSHSRKTDRPGRYRYTLRRDLIEWDFPSLDMGGSW